MDRHIKTQFTPDYVSHPGETLLEILEEFEMPQRELAKRTGLTPKTINGITNGISPISPDTALRLERVFGIPASFWNNRERSYREALVRNKERKNLDSFKIIEWLNSMPFKEMVNYGWIPRVKSDRIKKIQTLLNFFGFASPNNFNKWWANCQAKFRMSTARPINKGALAAWLRQGKILGREIDCELFNKSKFIDSLYKIRFLTVLDPKEFVPKAKKLCAESGVALVLVPELPNTGVWGASRWLTSNKALIQLSIRYKTNDHFWFSFFHEAAHILKHNKRLVYLENDSKYFSDEEREANNFAANILIPSANYRRLIRSPKLSKKLILRFSEQIGIHPGIIVGRLQHEGLLDYRFHNKLKMHLKWVISQ